MATDPMHMAIRFEVCSGEEPTPMTRFVRRLMMPLALLVPDCNPIYSKGSVCTRQTTKFRTAMASMDGSSGDHIQLRLRFIQFATV